MVSLCAESINSISSELRQTPQWVVWRYEPGDKKPRKVPYQPRNPQYGASPTNPEHWTLCEVALEQSANFNGVGFVFSADDDFAGIDLDDCRNPATGEIALWAKQLMHVFKGYAEISPSGTGVKLFGKGKLPGKGQKRGHIELYDQGRYFTVTGQVFPGSRSTLIHWDGALDELYLTMKILDNAIQEKGERFNKLFAGDFTDYLSASEADLALANMLVKAGADDEDTLLAALRLSGLWDDKWERMDYQQTTLQKALEQEPKRKNLPLKGDDDMSIAIALTDQLSAQIAFDVLTHSWRGFTGHTWQPLLDSDVLAIISRAIYSLLGQCRTRQVRDVLALIASPLRREFDTAPGVPMHNGVLQLDTRELRQYDRQDGYTWQLPFAYDPQAECPTILEWLRDAVGEEHVPLLRAFAKAVVMGYSTGQVYLEAYGPGGAGKSTFANLVRAMVGNKNTAVSSLTRLATNRFELAGFAGKRLAVFPDEKPFVRSIDTFKALTGLDPLPLELKGKNTGSHFVFHGLCIVTANEPLQSTDRSSGLGRRRLLVPFSRSTREWTELLDFRGDQAIGRFAGELSGFFNYLLDLPNTDMKELLKPFGKGSTAMQSTFREGLLETNLLAQWAEDCLVYDPEAKTLIGVREKEPCGGYTNDSRYLFPSYLAWSERQGKRDTMTLQNFSRDLVDLLTNQCGYSGVEKDRIAAGKVITGVRLRKDGDQRIITSV